MRISHICLTALVACLETLIYVIYEIFSIAERALSKLLKLGGAYSGSLICELALTSEISDFYLPLTVSCSSFGLLLGLLIIFCLLAELF